MSVTIQQVEYIAQLARLEFTKAEKEKLVGELNTILNYIDKLNELDTSNVEPLSQVIGSNNIFRDDVVRPSLPPGEVLQNAPDKTDEFFKVPKVIGDK